jgi:hypothetical protein
MMVFISKVQGRDFSARTMGVMLTAARRKSPYIGKIRFYKGTCLLSERTKTEGAGLYWYAESISNVKASGYNPAFPSPWSWKRR